MSKIFPVCIQTHASVQSSNWISTFKMFVFVLFVCTFKEILSVFTDFFKKYSQFSLDISFDSLSLSQVELPNIVLWNCSSWFVTSLAWCSQEFSYWVIGFLINRNKKASLKNMWVQVETWWWWWRGGGGKNFFGGGSRKHSFRAKVKKKNTFICNDLIC